MSIELEVRLGDQLISREQLAKLFSRILKVELGDDSHLALELDRAYEISTGNYFDFINIKSDENTEIQYHFYSAGSVELLGDEGGEWVNVSVVIRSQTSFFLMVVAAARLAKKIGCNIIDDASILGDEREISPNNIFDILEEIKGKTISDQSKYVYGFFKENHKIHEKLKH